MLKLSSRKGYIPKDDCNGCGSGWNANVVPDTIYGLDIRPVCCIHDDRYEHGLTRTDKQQADIEFLMNLLTVINSKKAWWYPTKLARLRAMDYYSFVKDYGDSAFFKGKDNG